MYSLTDKFIDSFRVINKSPHKYSWWSYRGGAREKNVGWRLDYMLASDRIVSEISETFILNDVMGSDHCPVGLDFIPSMKSR